MRVGDVQSRVDDRNIVTATLVQLLQKFLSLAVREANGIIVEVTPSLHVIDVVPFGSSDLVPRGVETIYFVLDLPNILKGNFKLFEVCYDILDHGPVGVTPATLVVAKGEILLHSRQTDGTCLVVHRDLRLSRTSIEGQVNATT